MLSASNNRQNWALVIIYSGYRTLLSLILTIMFLMTASDPIVGKHEPAMFIVTAGLFAIFSLALLIYQLFSPRVGNSAQVFTSLLLDITALVLIHHASVDDANGMALLILPTVAAGNMLLSARLGFLLAAMASIGLIADSFYRVLHEQQNSTEFVGAGMLGMAFFTTSIVVQYLTRRIVSAQALAEAREADVQQLLHISERIVQNMRTGILVLNSDGMIRLVNDAAIEMLGIQYRNSTMPQRAPRALLHALQKDRRELAQIRLQESGRLLQISRAGLSEGDADSTLLFIEDVSQLSQQAQQLKLASLGQFTASIAHEIRNPLGAISHAAQLLAESESLDQTDRRLIDIVEQQSARMNTVVENILQLSRRKSPKPEQFDLREWLARYCADFKATSAQACELITRIEGNRFTVNVDPDQLHQVLTIIVENGLRYSESATGERSLTFRVQDLHHQPGPILDIIDNGPGVNEENLFRIFEPFFTTETGGTGLGLYICKELCDANQMQLAWLRDDDGKSCFRLSFSHPQRRHAID